MKGTSINWETWLKTALFRFVRKLPFGEKLLIIANVLIHDWRVLPPAAAHNFMKGYVEANARKIQEIYKGIPDEERKIIQAYFTCVSIDANLYTAFFYDRDKLLKGMEKYAELEKPQRREMAKAWKKYHFGSSESLVWHHGLKNMPQSVLDYIKGKDFIDAGAFEGDSTFVFTQYQPRKVYAFEPSPYNQKLFLKNMNRLHVQESIYEIVPFGLDSRKRKICFQDTGDSSNNMDIQGNTEAELIPLDDFTEGKDCQIGLIKADIKGMGLEMVKGAEKTIRKYRPVLSLSVYHTPDELFGIRPLLESWNLDYHFYFQIMAYPLSELTLIGVPNEKWKTD